MPSIDIDRFWEVDFLRGVAIIMMILFHSLFALQFFGALRLLLVDTLFWIVFARITAIIFIFVAGISLYLSYSRQLKLKRNLKNKVGWKKYALRGLFIFVSGFIVTLVTWLYLKQGTVVFGILHFIGLSVIISYPFLKIKKDEIILLTAVLFLLLGFVVQNIEIGSSWLLWLGIQQMRFYTLDYFPLIPWFGVFLFGMFFARIFYRDYKRRGFLRGLNKLHDSNKTGPVPVWAVFLCFLGRHSLLIYLIHVPIIVLVIKALF